MQRFGRFISVVIIALLPLYYVRFSIFEIPTNVIEVLIGVALVAALFSDVPKKPIHPLLLMGTLLLIVGVGIGAIVAPATKDALGIFKGWFIFPIAYGFSIWRLFDQKSVSSLFYGVLFTTLTVSLYGILQWAGYIPLIAHQITGGNLAQYLEQSRALAFFESPNYLAMYLAPLTALSAAFIWQKSRSFVFVALVSLPAVVAIYLSGSRAGLVALASVLLVSFLWRKSAWLVAIIVGLLLASVGVYALAGPNQNSGDQARLFIWRQATSLVIEEPLTGIGPGQFQLTLDKKLADDEYYQREVRDYALHPHNLFLSTWLSGGFFGLLGLLIIVFTIFFSSAVEQHITRIRVGIIAALSAIVLHGFFDTTYFKNDLAIIFFVIIALWLVCENTGRRYDAS